MRHCEWQRRSASWCCMLPLAGLGQSCHAEGAPRAILSMPPWHPTHPPGTAKPAEAWEQRLSCTVQGLGVVKVLPPTSSSRAHAGKPPVPENLEGMQIPGAPCPPCCSHPANTTIKVDQLQFSCRGGSPSQARRQAR